MDDDLRGILIDDDEEDLKNARRLQEAGFPCIGLRVAATVDEMIDEVEEHLGDADSTAILLDYRLDDHIVADKDEKVRGYRGGTVAAALKERFPGLPIVLVTTEEKLHKSLEHNPEVYGLFDYQIMKDEFVAQTKLQTVVEKLRALTSGYQAITRTVNADTLTDPWSVIDAVIKARTEETGALIDAQPGSPPRSIREIARWLLSVVLAYPGPLLDAYETAVRLGITPASFDTAEVQAWLNEARYTGVFSELQVRWWNGRVENLLYDAAGDGQFGDAAIRAELIARRVGVANLEADHCVWCNCGDIASTTATVTGEAW